MAAPRGPGGVTPPVPTLPEPRSPDGYAITLVCLGNICRSPMADVVLEHRLAEAGLSGRVRVDGFWPAVGGAVVITLVTWMVDALVGTDD